MKKPINFAFFGTPDRAVWALDTLHALGFTPRVIITQPDKPQGRKLIITPPPAKVWAFEHNIPILQPEKLDSEFANKLISASCDLFIVVAYGKIIPQNILDIPKYGALNIHGSLLPKYRGASPVEMAILNDDKETGVSIILMDEKMDHGPIVTKDKVTIENWPPTSDELAKKIIQKGAELLINILPKWISGEIKLVEQDHSKATFTKKIKKEDGLINFNDESYKNYLKIQAYKNWPGTYFFINEKRIIIKSADYKENTLKIRRIIPEGKKEMDYEEFIKNQ
ncbi:MAG: methionyl-tRNA formyltransferase [Patescibacteria group bacterium]|nr:methionyl-tRNA formyltransferase [Patescibacteria group bacterium]